MNPLPVLLAVALLASCGPPADTGRNEVGNELTRPPFGLDDPPANEARPALGEAPAARPKPAAETAVIPLEYQGTYDENAEACAQASEYRLTVSPTELRFHESIGQVRRVTAGPGSLTVETDYQGEGESWRNVRELRLSGDGATLTISGEGVGIVRVRCTDSPRPV